MGTTKLIIRKSRLNSEGKTPIYIQYCYNQKTTLFSTGEKIEPIYWNPTGQTVKKTFLGFTALNAVLMASKERIDNVVREAMFNGLEPTIEYIKNFVDEKDTKKRLKSMGFFEVYGAFISEARGIRKQSTITVYKTTEKHLRGYERYISKRISFEKIDIDFNTSFIKYLYKLGHTDNTVGKYIKTLKTFLSYAEERELINKNSFRKFKVFKEETNIKFLTSSELASIESLNLSAKKKLDKTRDMFCLMCYTGLRFSDLKSLMPEHIKIINGVWCIELKMQKTKTNLTIPLNDNALLIIDKYNAYKNKLPVLSNQKINKYIKEICILAGINTLIQTVHIRGAERIERITPKHNLISNHSGRHTFATLSLENKMRPEVLQQLLGHKSINTTMKYVRITDTVKAEEMKKAWNKSKLRMVS